MKNDSSNDFSSEEYSQYLEEKLRKEVDESLLDPDKLSVEDIIYHLNQPTRAQVSKACASFYFAGIEKLIAKLVKAFPSVKNWWGRHNILYDLVEYSRKYKTVYDLAINSLNDKSYWVRMDACDALGYSLRDEAIPFLKPLLHDKSSNVRLAASEAIRRIENKIDHTPHIIGASLKINDDSTIEMNIKRDVKI